jgi:ABC-type multidrug transport system fused ATPase/permease subunit
MVQNDKALKDLMGEAEYEKSFEIVQKIVNENKGTFQSISDLIDIREDILKKFKLNQGFKVPCGLKGGKLSGGQKQRVAIARAVVRKPNILILDEATSALDENSQRLVQEALKNVMENRTSIVIAHRLTTVEKCSRLVVIEDGKVVEEGAPQDLKTKEGGFFANLSNGMRKQDSPQKE